MMTKLSAFKDELQRRVSDVRSKLRFDNLGGVPTQQTNQSDSQDGDPSRVSSISLNPVGVGNGHGPIIGGYKH